MFVFLLMSEYVLRMVKESPFKQPPLKSRNLMHPQENTSELIYLDISMWSQ